MDEIQRMLVKIGRKDLAQGYFKKVTYQKNITQVKCKEQIMDEIQKVLIKVGRKDLAQKYYLKVARNNVTLDEFKKLTSKANMNAIIVVNNRPISEKQIIVGDNGNRIFIV